MQSIPLSLLLCCCLSLSSVAADGTALNETTSMGNSNPVLKTTTASGLKAMATTTAYEPRCKEARNRTTYPDRMTYPDWFVEGYIVPWYALLCKRPLQVYEYERNSTTVMVLTGFVDKQTRRAVPHFGFCDAALAEFPFIFAFNYYEAFYGILSPADSYTRLVKLLGLLILFCTPLAAFTLIFGLHVIKKFLQLNADTHAYMYHTLIVYLSFTLYVVSALRGAKMFAVLVLPLCYSDWRYLAAGIGSFAEGLFTVVVDSLHCTSHCVQALLALDRYLALFAPLFYHHRYSKRLVLFQLVGCLAVNFAIFILQFFAIAEVLKTFFGVFNSPPFWSTFITMSKLAMLTRFSLFSLSILVQFISCGGVVFKLQRHSRMPENVSGTLKAKLQSCKLLFGTCFINFSVGVIQCLSLIVRFVGYDNFGNRNIGDLVTSAVDVQAYLVPLSTAGSFLVHCASSSQYRQIAADTTTARLFLWPYHKLGHLCKNRISDDMSRSGQGAATETDACNDVSCRQPVGITSQDV